MPLHSPEPAPAIMWLPIHHEHRHTAHFGRPAPQPETSRPGALVGYEYSYYPSYYPPVEALEPVGTYLEPSWADAACTTEQAQILARHGGGVLPRLQTTFADAGDAACQASPTTSSWADSPCVATPSPTLFGTRASPAIFAPTSNAVALNHANYMFYPDYYASQTIAPHELVLASQPTALKVDTSATSYSKDLSASQVPAPALVTPQPRHPADRVQQLLQRYIAAPPSPDRSYEVFREDTFNRYHAHLASQYVRPESYVAIASKTDGVAACERQDVSPMGLGISVPSRAVSPTLPRKPSMMACLFCRGRKIACNAPPLGTPNRTCAQCAKRNQPCVFPTVCRRGQKRSAPTPPTETTSASDASSGATSKPEDDASDDNASASGPARKRARQ